MCFSNPAWKMNWTAGIALNATTFNNTNHKELKELYKQYDSNQAVSDVVYWTLIVAYSILIVLGCIGNLAVIIAVAGNKRK